MIISIDKEKLYQLVQKQLSNILIFNEIEETEILLQSINRALEKLEYCLSFGGEKRKYWKRGDKPYFNVFHTDQYAMFLYFLSHLIYKEFNMSELASKVYYLNKILHGVDIYFEIELPDIFSLDHPVGTVLGRANYSNFFGVSQNCTVGNINGIFPRFGHHVELFARAMVLGNCKVGNYCLIAANTVIKNQDIPDNSLIFGESPNLTIIELKNPYLEEIWSE